MLKMQEGRGDFLPRATQRHLINYHETKTDFLVVEGTIDWGIMRMTLLI